MKVHLNHILSIAEHKLSLFLQIFPYWPLHIFISFSKFLDTFSTPRTCIRYTSYDCSVFEIFWNEKSAWRLNRTVHKILQVIFKEKIPGLLSIR